VLPPGELTCIKLATVRAQKLHIFWRYLSWSFFCVCCLLINCIGKPFFLLKQMLLPDIRHVSGTEFFVFQHTVPCSPSQGNSCTVNDWDTWFYSACVVASEPPGPQSCWLLCLDQICYKNMSTTAPRLTMWSTFANSASWLNRQLLIIALSHRPMLSGVCDCMLVFALPVNIVSIARWRLFILFSLKRTYFTVLFCITLPSRNSKKC